jgi:MFS family permease
MTALFCGSALMNAAMAVASAVSTIVTGDRLGAGWAAVPNTAGIVGTGAGALVLTRLMARHGRKVGLTCGYLASAGGAVLAVAAVARANIPTLSAGMLLLGLGNAGAQLSRYAAAELYPVDRRGFAIGTVVWAGAVGAVGGPLLLATSSNAAGALGGPALTGPYLLAAVTTLAAAAVVGGLRTRAVPTGPAEDGPRLRQMARERGTRVALAVMVTAQAVMVAVMTATPLDMHMHGQGLGPVGMTLSAHTFGMFALAPLTGRLLDRFGARPVMIAGLLTLAVAVVLAAAIPENGALLRTGALFLLGYGWNLCFVGGSGRLARDLPESARAHVEGAVDAAVWGIAAVASLTSTMALSAGGYGTLAGIAGVLLVLPAALLLRDGGKASSGERSGDTGATAPGARV